VVRRALRHNLADHQRRRWAEPCAQRLIRDVAKRAGHDLLFWPAGEWL